MHSRIKICSEVFAADSLYLFIQKNDYTLHSSLIVIPRHETTRCANPKRFYKINLLQTLKKNLNGKRNLKTPLHSIILYFCVFLLWKIIFQCKNLYKFYFYMMSLLMFQILKEILACNVFIITVPLGIIRLVKFSF